MKSRTALRTTAAGAAMLMTFAGQACAQGTGAVPHDLGQEILRTLIWLVVAGVLFFVAFKIVDLSTPGDLKQQLADGNVALAIYVGSLAISFAIIIAALLG